MHPDISVISSSVTEGYGGFSPDSLASDVTAVGLCGNGGPVGIVTCTKAM